MCINKCIYLKKVYNKFVIFPLTPFKIMPFSNVEYANMYLLYGESCGNASAAVRLYGARFPNRRVPSRQTLVEVAQGLRETGLLQPSVCGRDLQRSNCVLNIEDPILNATEVNPGK
jgi:hypothetical protein